MAGRTATLQPIMKRRETLSEYVSRIMRVKNLTHVKVAKRARALGGELSPAFMNSIKQGLTTSPKVDTLKSLALGLGEPEEDVIDVARGRQLSDDPGYKASTFAIMYNEYRRLPDADKRELAGTIEILKQAIQQRLPTDED